MLESRSLEMHILALTIIHTDLNFNSKHVYMCINVCRVISHIPWRVSVVTGADINQSTNSLPNLAIILQLTK